MRPGPIIVAAGGTGGHMFPALATAEALRRRGADVAVVTDARGARFVTETLCRVVAAASPSGGLAGTVRGLAALARGLVQTRACFAEFRPTAVACFGGYAAVPAALAAMLGRTPYLVHEQNAVFGRANRLIARGARMIALSFEATRGLPRLPGTERFVTGNPVRPGFAAGATPRDPDGVFSLLVLGGSQGARVLSELIPAALARLAPGARNRIEVAQQCRPEDLDRTRAAYAEIGLAAELSSFFDDVPARMASADLVIARSGASTIAELLTLGRPSILIPYPHAAEDHQTANATALAQSGAALLLPQSEASAERVAATLEALTAAPDRLAAMQDAARRLARPDAADRIAEAVLSLVPRVALSLTPRGVSL